ncbi:alpha-L-fucosidase [Mangrovibacterium marinum]|uniref:alpha-L-fucosidase n=1 Tax=Mangrovibacterium marinum TaxID=1639118 RepID=A0A2T5BVZ5_9BACT|nr:alpha-L-fucosidase [Mangrovibacterium marinum]PTN03804.1 alpha-L-fucosidase [Mangrovibacterium marinum]
MNTTFKNSISILALAFALLSCQHKTVAPPTAVGPVPDERQLAWHEMELNAFIHFTINTYTGKEWGYGNESPALLHPTEFDAEQWVSTLKDTGFKGVILTCKHHDGFCLWPSEYTDHDIAQSPFQDGKGDIVKAVSDACHKFGLKFGVYMSPWDRNRADYGQPSYVEYYRNQLKELFTNYGPVFEMWFDGANGGDGYYGGANEMRKIDRKSYYDWPATLEMVHKIQPEVLFFSDGGPDLRWVGNEEGRVNPTNWNTITADTLYAGKAGISGLLETGAENGADWVPAEVDISIRPGWFYHQEEDSKVKTPEELFNIYMSSVGRGSTLLLNIPPDQRGLFHENDIASLQGFRKLLDERFGNNLAKNGQATATETRGNAPQYAASNVLDEDADSYWATNDSTTTASLEIELPEAKEIKYIQLSEYIKLGQRVKAFNVEILQDNAWVKVAEETTIGYKRILTIDPVVSTKVRINIEAAKACPLISNVSLY